MRHFALINPDNVVIQVNPIEDKHLLNSAGQCTESKGVEYFQKFYKQYDYSSGFRWLETKEDGSFRNIFAGIGMIYIKDLNCFMSSKPYSSWKIRWKTREDENRHYYWSAPTDPPDDDNHYVWDEDLYQTDREVASAGWKLVTEE